MIPRFSYTISLMTSSLRTQLIIGAASLLCLLLAGTAFVLLREIGPGPASLLPAERTVMLVSKMPPATQRMWQDVLPDLKNAPLQEQGTEIAALVRTGNATEWITFDARGVPSTQTVLLHEGETPLSSDDMYRRLSATYTTASPWLFARFPETELMIEGLTVPSSPVSIAMGTGSIQLAWPSRMGTAFTGPVIKETTGTIFRLNAANLSSFIKQTTGILSASVRTPAEALLQSWVRSIVGDDLSVTYDIGAMLNGAGVAVVRSASGALGMVVRVLPADAADMTLNAMEQGAIASAGGAEHVERVFDEKFTFETMKAGTDVTPSEEERAGWTIRTIVPDTFINARHSREFAVATGKDVLNDVIDAMLGGAVQRVADGMLVEPRVTELLRQWHIPLNLPLNLIPGTGDRILWSMDREGGLAVLTMERPHP
jgi:hypothetical protein